MTVGITIWYQFNKTIFFSLILMILIKIISMIDSLFKLKLVSLILTS